MATSREYFIRAVMLKDIRVFSLEILQVSDNIMYILDDVEGNNKSVFPGKVVDSLQQR